MDEDVSDGWFGGGPDAYVKAWISGESEESAVVQGDYSPTWGSTLDMGCPSNVNATLYLQLFEVRFIPRAEPV